MEVIHSLVLTDSKICADGEPVSVSCQINILKAMVNLEDEPNPHMRRGARKRRRRRLPKEDEKEKLFSSAEYEFEVTSCSDTIKGRDYRTRPEIEGRELVAEVEGLRNFGLHFNDVVDNSESLMVRQGRIRLYEPPTETMRLLGYTKSDHVGNLAFKLVIEQKQVVDERELWVGMTLTMQAMADAIMLNDTGIMFEDLEPTYQTSTKIVSAEVEWENIINSPCSPYFYATSTYVPTHGPTSGPTSEPTSGPSPSPTSRPSLSPTSRPSLSPTSRPSPSPTSGPSPSPTLSPSSSPTTVPGTPTEQPSGSPTSDLDALDAMDFFTRPYPGEDYP
eukprot:scaffold874_cov126-Cylindrotheca_fusiformis.AAC.8